jgi:hypothetical protein
MRVPIRRPVAGLVCAALVLGPLPVRAEETIRCDSRGFRYTYCRVSTDNRVSLVRTHGFASCREGSSWGYDRWGVWVDRGCSGEFRVGRGGGGHHGAVAAGAAIAGIAIIAALAASNKSKQEAEVPSWAVGSFSGYDEFERTQVELTVLPGGAVQGRAGSTDFTGSFTATRLEAGRHRFSVQRSGNGFEALDDSNANHRVLFQRTGSGY